MKHVFLQQNLSWSCSAVLLLATHLLGTLAEVGAQRIYENGDPSCPCIMNTSLVPSVDYRDYLISGQWDETIGIQVVNSSDYGIGCFPHDATTPQCVNDTINDCASRRNLVPPPLDCDTSWCKRNWCFVDPRNCSLAFRKNSAFPNSERYFSYATCGDMDAFTDNKRFAALEGQTFRVGLNSNSGGWQGSFHSEGLHFQGPVTKWSGLAVDFVVKGAYRGNFFLNLSQPPDFLRERSLAYFGTDNQFDLCIYATSLGYLDICVAQYTITDQRASSNTDWLILTSQGLYLVVDTEANELSTVQFILKSVATIFQPFTPETWAFIVFFVIPVLGILMLVHERGKGGSAFPTEEAVVVLDESTGGAFLKKRPVPFSRSVAKSIYIAFLAVLQQSYEHSVLTLGAMLNLLGISFFILTIVAVYTANLAAMLTQDVQEVTIDSFEDAVRAGYRFCSERKNMETVMNLYPNLNPSIFVVDPIELGGDGLPGFACNQCDSRRRVFDFIDPMLADVDSRYCHAAVSPTEDLEIMYASARHCNKTIVGKAVQTIQHGMPIFETVSPQLISFFLKLKNDGQYDESVASHRPTNQCPISSGGEGSALNIPQLSGIWVVSFAFALLGLLVKYGQQRHKERRQRNESFHVTRVYKRDQRGERVDTLGIQDSWMTPPEEHNDTNDPRRHVLIHQGSTAGSIYVAKHSQGESDQDGSATQQGDSPRAGDKSLLDLAWILTDKGSRRSSGKLIRRRRSDPSRCDRSGARSEGPQDVALPGDSFDDTAISSEAQSIVEKRQKLLEIIDEQTKMTDSQMAKGIA